MAATPISAPVSLVAGHAADRWARSLERHRRRVDVLERAVLALLDGELNDELRELAESEAHSLAGSIGALGLRNGTRLARALEQSFGAPHTLGRVFASRLADQVLALRGELERPLAFDEIEAAREPRRRILLVSDDDDRADQYAAEGIARGLVMEVTRRELAGGIIDASRPDAVIIELRDDRVPDGLALVSEIGRRFPGLPTLVVAGGDGMELRLTIARSGASGPVPLSHPAADVLMAATPLLEIASDHHASILVVETDPDVLRESCLTLQRDGHTVHALADPGRFWETLDSVSPDLVVTGTSMAQVSGLELCRALRADPRWRELPVIVVTSDDDEALARCAYLAGADDLLRKPTDLHDVSTRVGNRLQRSRLLRRNADADVLTGLANRRKAEWDLDRFLRIARRHRHEVSLIVFRIDGLTEHAAVHGHATSEEALRWFSQLLRQSFRAEDIVARWDDDFVVGLFDAASEHAVTRGRQVMTALRDHYVATSTNGRLALSCSVGVATFPEDAADAQTLYGSADAALVAARAVSPSEAIGVASNPYARVNGRVDVVLVENDPAVAGLIIHALESRQYAVRWLRHGHEAAAALLGDQPELRARLVLMEVNLPAFDGLSILRALSEQGKLRHTRAVILSARSTEAEVVQAFELGVFDHIAKPFSVSILIARVQRALAL